MNLSWRDHLRRSFWYDWFGGFKQAADLRAWERAGRPLPPPHRHKQRVLREVAARLRIKVLIETGTYLGDMVRALRDDFREIYTLELSDALHARARRKFAAFPHIHCLNGDSADLLPSVLRRLGEPCLFWLDGHYSGPGTAGAHRPCPVVGELEAIAAHTVRRHAVLIDDARLFTGAAGYPSREELGALCSRLFPGFRLTELDDAFHLLPPE
jgi:hypothetical protein